VLPARHPPLPGGREARPRRCPELGRRRVLAARCLFERVRVFASVSA
jgi:hypothetical protein